ncbi:Eco29kI family restriction endonuclease [Caulobacter vibrioides]|nr:Eco29kI family restriction endonuclease [Caulobacter vibrioides]
MMGKTKKAQASEIRRSPSEPYNPLARINIARSIEAELLSREVLPLSKTDQIEGAGIYAIYYSGLEPIYAPARNDIGSFVKPIYVGKAIPKGGRKGGLTPAKGISRALAERLRQHAASVNEVINLDLSDFCVRYLVVDDIWIPLGENILIETFKPAWNRAVDGFGNKDPGRRRKTQFRSPWDVLHPGRLFAEKLAESPVTATFMETRVSDYFANRKMAKLPRKVLEQQAEEEALEQAET